MPPPFIVTFSAGDAGPWRIERLSAVAGPGLPAATHLTVTDTPNAAWHLRGALRFPDLVRVRLRA